MSAPTAASLIDLLGEFPGDLPVFAMIRVDGHEHQARELAEAHQANDPDGQPYICLEFR